MAWNQFCLVLLRINDQDIRNALICFFWGGGWVGSWRDTHLDDICIVFLFYSVHLDNVQTNIYAAFNIKI